MSNLDGTPAGVMLVDGDCGFCRRSAAWVLRRGVRVESATIQETDLAAAGVDAERVRTDVPFLHPDGRVDYGHRAWAAILRTGPLPWRVLGRLLTAGPFDLLAARIYRWVAANRSTLSRFWSQSRPG